MKVVYAAGKQGYKSIKEFDEVIFPDFAVLTGLNGSGKSHFLDAIVNDKVKIDNLTPDKVKLFNYETFKITAQNINIKNIDQRISQAWMHFARSPNSINTNKTLQGESEVIFNAIFSMADSSGEIVNELEYYNVQVNSLSNLDISIGVKCLNEAHVKSKLQKYIDAIRVNIINSQHILRSGMSALIVSALKSSDKFLHKITAEDFKIYSKPISDNFLLSPLSAIITSYLIKQYDYVDIELRINDSSRKYSELLNGYEKKFIPPWLEFNEILKKINSYSTESSIFNFALNYPNKNSIGRQNYQEYFYEPYLVDLETGAEIKLNDLSSGEKVLLALAVSIYSVENSSFLPELLLFDEIEATLHPSMVKALLDVIVNVYVNAGTKVILTTHSPTTVALADEESLFVVNKGKVKKKFQKSIKSDALRILTEGYVTLDEGILLIDSLQNTEITIITEGRNTNLIEHAIRLLGLASTVSVVKGVEGKSGDTQLRTIFDFISSINTSGRVIFVWDCDCLKYSNLLERNSVYPFVVPLNTNNNLAKKGIENIFDEVLFDGFISEFKDSRGKKVCKFDIKRKVDFEKFILNRNELNDYKGLQVLFDLIKSFN